MSEAPTDVCSMAVELGDAPEVTWLRVGDVLMVEYLKLPREVVSECGSAAQTLGAIHALGMPCFHKAETIAEVACLPLRTVERHLKELDRAEWICNQGRQIGIHGRKRRTVTIEAGCKLKDFGNAYYALPRVIAELCRDYPWRMKLLMAYIVSRMNASVSGGDHGRDVDTAQPLTVPFKTLRKDVGIGMREFETITVCREKDEEGYGWTTGPYELLRFAIDYEYRSMMLFIDCDTTVPETVLPTPIPVVRKSDNAAKSVAKLRRVAVQRLTPSPVLRKAAEASAQNGGATAQSGGASAQSGGATAQSGGCIERIPLKPYSDFIPRNDTRDTILRSHKSNAVRDEDVVGTVVDKSKIAPTLYGVAVQRLDLLTSDATDRLLKSLPPNDYPRDAEARIYFHACAQEAKILLPKEPCIGSFVSCVKSAIDWNRVSKASKEQAESIVNELRARELPSIEDQEAKKAEITRLLDSLPRI